MGSAFKSPLHEMTATTPTCLWNDSADPADLAFALEHGAVGATCNPVIAHGVLKARLAEWRPRIAALIESNPTATEDEIGWMAVEQLSIDAARLLMPAFETHGGRNGRLSIQTDPRLARDPDAIVRQAAHFNRLAPNVIVKIPATSAGIVAIEEATARGISINATVSFTVSQTMAVAEAVERGLSKRRAAGQDIEAMGPVCTIMVGRLDDWLKVVMERQAIAIDPGYLEWAGIAAFKEAYRLYRERGYRTRLLAAAFRNPMHWSALVGGDIVISPPPPWLRRLAASDLRVVHAIDAPVAPAILDDLCRRFQDFRRASSERGLSVAEFDSFPPTRRTLRQFLAACHELSALVRDIMVPNPDIE
jgi:transaldolase